MRARSFAGLVGLAAMLGVAGCSSIDLESFRAPDLSIFTPRSVAKLKQTDLKPVTAEDLVGPDGRCASAFVTGAPSSDDAAPTAAQAPGADSVPPVPGGIALDMTECEVVKRAGTPEQVQIGTNERNERTATLTYIHGDRPGIYHFTSGRLTSMERAPEPPKPARRTKPKAKPKPKARPNTVSAT